MNHRKISTGLLVFALLTLAVQFAATRSFRLSVPFIPLAVILAGYWIAARLAGGARPHRKRRRRRVAADRDRPGGS